MMTVFNRFRKSKFNEILSIMKSHVNITIYHIYRSIIKFKLAKTVFTWDRTILDVIMMEYNFFFQGTL